MFLCRKLVIRHYYFFLAVFFLATFFLAAAFGAAFFLTAAFLATFFLVAAFFATAFLATFFLVATFLVAVAAFFFATFYSSAKRKHGKDPYVDDNSHMLASGSFSESRKSPHSQVIAVATALTDLSPWRSPTSLDTICTVLRQQCNMFMIAFQHISDNFSTSFISDCKSYQRAVVQRIAAIKIRASQFASLASCQPLTTET